jgi:gliding motility-associated-like protein
LTWNAFDGWSSGVDHYVLQKFDAQGQLIQSYNTGTSTNFNDDTQDPDNQVYHYLVIAHPVQPTIDPSVSNTRTVIKDPNIFYPNTFTPNDDLLNDTFVVFGQYTATAEFQIYNRWGELLYYTTDISKGWDGTFNGKLMPEGTYYFKVVLIDLAGRTAERSGTILLLHKLK